MADLVITFSGGTAPRNGSIAHNDATASYTVLIGDDAVDTQYQLLKDGVLQVGQVTGNAADTGGFTLTLASPAELPTIGTTSTYQVQGRDAALGGTYLNCSLVGGGNASFTIRRLAGPPTVNDTQTFDTTSASSQISHAVALTNSGTGGTLNYNATATSAYPSSGWVTGNVSLTRGSSYYLWARTDSASTSADSTSTALFVPYSTAAFDTAISATSTASGFPNVSLTSATTSIVIAISGATSTTQYGIFKGAAASPSATGTPTSGATTVNITLSDLATSSYSIKARLASGSGGDPNGAWTACTGTNTTFSITVTNVTATPNITSAVQKFTISQLATCTVTATSAAGTNLYIGQSATGPWTLATSGVAFDTAAYAARGNTINNATVYAYATSTGNSDSAVTSRTWTAAYNQPTTQLNTLSISPAPSAGTVTVFNTTDQVTVNWTKDVNDGLTRYRLINDTQSQVCITGGPNVLGGIIGDGLPASDTGVPAIGQTESYAVQALIAIADGGSGNAANCTFLSLPAGHTNPFSIRTADITPESYTALGGNVTNAPLNAYYYATFSTDVPTTTLPGTGFLLSSTELSTGTNIIPYLATNGLIRINNGSFIFGSGNTSTGNTFYFQARAASTTATTTEHKLKLGTIERSFTITTTDGTATNLYTALAGNVANAVLNTYYYATFSTTVAGTVDPGTGLTVSDTTQNITVTSTNGEFRTAANTTWRTSDTAVPPNSTIYFRARSSVDGGVQIQHTLVIGTGVNNTRSFTTTTVSDITPENYTALAGNVSTATIDGYYYATFSATTAGTTQPGTGFALTNQVNAPVQVTTTNGQIRTVGNTTWRSAANEVVSKTETVYFRGVAASTGNTLTTHTLQIGATQRSFTTTTVAGPNTAIGTVLVSKTELTGGSTENVSVSWTPVTNPIHNYKIVRIDSGTEVDVTPSVTSSPQNLNYAESGDLPLTGVTASYLLKVSRTVANGGDGSWATAKNADGTNAAWTILRIKKPTVDDIQIFDTSSPSPITHTVDLVDLGVGGTLEYGYHVTTSTGSPSYASVTTWYSSPEIIAAFNRLSYYYLFARRAATGNAADFDSAGPFLIPAYSPAEYGVAIYSTSGAKTVLGPDSLPTNLITCKVGVSITNYVLLSGNATATITAPGVTPTNGADVFIIVTPDGDANNQGYYTVTRGTNSFTLQNTDTVQKTFYFIVGRYR